MPNLEKKTKVDFIEAVHQRLVHNKGSEMNVAVVREVIDAFLDELGDVLVQGHTVELRGLGVFEFRHRKAKSNARNPKTGKKVEVPSHSIVAFRAGNRIKSEVWDTDFGKKD